MVKNIFLINPCYKKQEVLGPFSKYITSQLPLSIGFLAGYLEKRGVTPFIFDEQLGQISESELNSVIEKNGIRIVGISVLTLTAKRAYEIAGLIRKNWPDVKIVMGGVHATLLPSEPLEKGFADFVVRQEGEKTLHELIDEVFHKENYFRIHGLSFIDGKNIIHNPARPLIEDLDELPAFPYHLFEKNMRSYQFGNMVTARGCPYSCIFCSQGQVSGRKYRRRSPQKVVDELEVLVKEYGQDFIFFNDDNFIVDKKNVYELCDKIIAKKFPRKLKLGFNARGDSVDEKLLERMREAHFTTVLFGLETGSERIMKLIKKGETVEDITRGVWLAKRAGFIVSGQFILGFPTETKEDLRMTIRHARKLPLDYTRFNLLVPYPGSEIFQMANIEKGTICNEDNWSNYASHSGLTGKTIPYVPEGLTARDLLRLQWRGNLMFFLRPKQMLNVRNLRYAMANQLVLPDPKTVKGFFEIVFFMIRLFFYFVKSLIINFIKSLMRWHSSKMEKRQRRKR